MLAAVDFVGHSHTVPVIKIELEEFNKGGGDHKESFSFLSITLRGQIFSQLTNRIFNLLAQLPNHQASELGNIEVFGLHI